MPIFNFGDKNQSYQDKLEAEARRQRRQSSKDLTRENKNTGGRGTKAERSPNARDEHDINELRGWVMGEKKRPNVTRQTAEDKRAAAKVAAEKKRQDAQRDREDAARMKKQSEREAAARRRQERIDIRKSRAADSKMVRENQRHQRKTEAADRARMEKDTAKFADRVKNENIRNYDNKSEGRKIENKRADLIKKHGPASKQVTNYNKKNPPPPPKKRGFFS